MKKYISTFNTYRDYVRKACLNHGEVECEKKQLRLLLSKNTLISAIRTSSVKNTIITATAATII